MSRKPRLVADRFWEKVNKLEGDDSCWEWTGSLSHRGYGRFRVGKKIVRSTHFSWEIENGPIPEELNVLHTCDNPKCVRPKHLFTGTNKDNTRDMMSKDRQARGETNGWSKLTWEQVYFIRDSGLSRKELSRKLNVCPSTIYNIKSKKRWWPEPRETKCP